jgi:prepilin-type N-terminal cleavage/methylation domain-containing protein
MATASRRSPDESGFSLIEICVALILLALLLNGVAHLFIVSIRAADAARVQSATAMLADQKIEQLRGLQWAVDVNGQPLGDVTSDLSVEPATSTGGGLRPSPASALDLNTPGYVDYLDARGTWVGTGATPPGGARYIRRWRIQPLPEDPQGTVIVQVLVTTVTRDRQARTPRARLADDALVTTIWSRRAH